VPHKCIGLARRMQVSGVDVQAETMVEAVQNHTPSCLIIDEIGRRSEVQAALTCKERGVRIIASAHGGLVGLVRNSELSGLVGGVDSVTVGDRAANQRYNGSKLRTQRKGPPIFDVIIELEKGNLNEWKVVAPCSAAVDSILNNLNGSYQAEIRVRPHAGGSPATIRTVTVQGSTDGEPNGVGEVGSEKMFADEASDCDSDHEEDSDSTNCPSCNKAFVHRLAMLDHALHKDSCRVKLGKAVLSSFKAEFGK